MREERMARAFVEFSDTLVRDYDVVEFLARLCQRSVEVLEVTAAGALLTDGARRLQVVAASTETVTVLETLQIQRQEGPCVDAYRSGRRVAVPDLRRVGRRWPVFTPRALGAGMAGVCAFPMRLRADRIGALNVFQATPGSFDQAAVLAGQALADVATIAILQARAVEDAAWLAGQLEHALESRVVVEQAKGILAERHGIDPEVAFAQLRRHGRQSPLPHNMPAQEPASARFSTISGTPPSAPYRPPRTWPRTIDRTARSCQSSGRGQCSRAAAEDGGTQASRVPLLRRGT
jgi:ANTAR domain/GAF domain